MSHHPKTPLPIVGRTPERKDAAENREKILAAARVMLRTRSMRDICMDELADKAGVGKGTLYRRFSDRTSLCFALLDDSETKLQNNVIAGFGLPPSASRTERLRVVLRALLEFEIAHADVLDEARRSLREPGMMFQAPPYRWRHQLLTRLFRPADDAVFYAHAVLSAMSLVHLRRSEGATKANVLVEQERFWEKFF